MTDKELAKESWWNDDCCSGALPTEKIYECGFMAGLKAGRPKWHKIADGDLPDNTDSVLSDKGVIVYYNFTHACWVDERTSVAIDDVIAWCEIPQYTGGSR